MKKSDMLWQTYLNIEKEILNLSKYIFFTDEKWWYSKKGNIVRQPCEQLETFSPHIADLLIQCCVQIESISKELYFDNGGQKQRGDSSLLFDVDCLSLINTKWNTDNKCVMVSSSHFNLTNTDNKILYPLRKAYEKGKTVWAKSYQAVKHDRYNSLCKGTVKALLHASAALYLLNLYYRNDSWKTSHQNIPNFDYSMGSRIFSVKPPVAELLWETNKPIPSESPYVVRYIDTAYDNIKKIKDDEAKKTNEYFYLQPELQDEKFLAEFSHCINNNDKLNLFEKCIFLGRYRINKRIPKTLSFEKRKELLINSNEWKNKQNKRSEPLLPDNITEENIQDEIDSIGRSIGVSLCGRFQKFAWVDIAEGQEVCTVYIPK